MSSNRHLIFSASQELNALTTTLPFNPRVTTLREIQTVDRRPVGAPKAATCPPPQQNPAATSAFCDSLVCARNTMHAWWRGCPGLQQRPDPLTSRLLCFVDAQGRRTISTKRDTRGRPHVWQLQKVHRGVGSLGQVARTARSMELQASGHTPRLPTRHERLWQSRRYP